MKTTRKYFEISLTFLEGEKMVEAVVDFEGIFHFLDLKQIITFIIADDI